MYTSSDSTSESSFSPSCFRFFFLIFELVALLGFLRADSGTSSSSSDSIFLFTLGDALDLDDCIDIHLIELKD